MGKKGPYFQSHRLKIYKKFCDALIETGGAYYCFCTADRLKQMRREQGGKRHHKTKYDRLCYGVPLEEAEKRIANGEPYVVRMLIPPGQTEFQDMIHGNITFDNNSVDD